MLPEPSDDPTVRAEREALFESIIENMGESVLVLDRHGRQVFGNKMLRIFSGEDASTEDRDRWRAPGAIKIFDAEGRELAPTDWPVARALRGDYQDNFEIRVHGMAHRTGETILLTSTRSLVNREGRIEGAVVVTRDITTVRQTEENLQQSQKLETIGQLTGGIAHDFNNVLAAILSAAEVLRRGVAGDDRLDLAASTIEKAALRGADLTRHLLAFARKQTLAPVAIDLNALVEETRQLLRPALGATIQVNVREARGVYALADPSQVTSALLNLCVNARDAMGEAGGAITISLAEEGGFALLTVADNGAGMSPEVLRRACEPFFTTKGVGKGSGLGLSMVYGFAQQSGGDLRIKSEIGRGTTVTLMLPRAAAPAPVAPKPEELDVPQGALRVLVVDDDELARDAVCMLLADAGFSAIAATSGPDAMGLIDQGLAFDLLLTDMVMPQGMSGLALAEAVRQRRPNVRTIVSTGYVDKELPEPGPGWAVLRKPYTSAELFGALRAVMLGGR